MTSSPNFLWQLRDGNGPSPETNQQATIKYVGHLPDGSVFDQSQGEFQFTVGRGVISGWSVGVVSMKVVDCELFNQLRLQIW
jgi:FKBP-type peptidyl-prolyl cis-trans isomerase